MYWAASGAPFGLDRETTAPSAIIVKTTSTAVVILTIFVITISFQSQLVRIPVRILRSRFGGDRLQVADHLRNDKELAVQVGLLSRCHSRQKTIKANAIVHKTNHV